MNKRKRAKLWKLTREWCLYCNEEPVIFYAMHRAGSVYKWHKLKKRNQLSRWNYELRLMKNHGMRFVKSPGIKGYNWHEELLVDYIF